MDMLLWEVACLLCLAAFLLFYAAAPHRSGGDRQLPGLPLLGNVIALGSLGVQLLSKARAEVGGLSPSSPNAPCMCPCV